jgi:hypothetical protein
VGGEEGGGEDSLIKKRQDIIFFGNFFLKCRDIDVLKRDRKNAQGNNGNTNVEELHLAAEVVNKKEGRLTFVFATLWNLGKKPGVDFVFELVLQVFILSKHMGACGKEATKGGKGGSGVHLFGCCFRLVVWFFGSIESSVRGSV